MKRCISFLSLVIMKLKMNKVKCKILVYFTLLLLILNSCIHDINHEFKENESSLIEISFDSDKTKKIFIERIHAAKESIDISIYGLGEEEIVENLVEVAQNKELSIRIITDYDSEHEETWQELMQAGIEVGVGNSNGIMHNKYIIIDKEYIITGSTNLSASFHRHFNNTILLKSKDIAQEYLLDFEMQKKGSFASKKSSQLEESYSTEGEEIYWPQRRHLLDIGSALVYFTPYKGNFLNYTHSQNYPSCEKSCLEQYKEEDDKADTKSFSSSNALCKFNNCPDKACFLKSTRKNSYDKIVYQYINYNKENKKYCATYENAMNVILYEVAKARKSILVLAFSLRDPVLQAKLIEMEKEKNVEVKLWMDYNQFSAGYKQNVLTVKALADNLSLAKVSRRNEGGLLHHKVIVIDGKTTILGSLNFSRNAVSNNDENFIVFYDNPFLAKSFYREAARIDLESYDLKAHSRILNIETGD